MTNDLSDFAPEYLASLRAQDFTSLLGCGSAHLCNVSRLSFTRSLAVDVDLLGHGGRYCYERHGEAEAAFAAWDGDDHPGGPWIKCEGATIEMLNPASARNQWTTTPDLPPS